MAYRRIIQLSPTTKVVSLPTKWLTNNRIKKGDYVNIEESGNQILVETIKSNSLEIYSDLTEMNDDLLWTAIDAFYMLGYSKIELKVNQEQKKLLTKIVKYFPMFVISLETAKTVELRSVASDLEMDFEKTVEHIRHMTLNMADEALSMIAKKNWTSLVNIKKIDYNLNTYISMCFRQLNSGKIKNTVAWAQFVKIIELYADRLCMLCDDISKLKAINKTDVSIIKKINTLYDDSFKLMKKFSVKKANEHDETRIAIDKLAVKSPLYIHFIELTRSIYDIQEIVFQLNHKEI